MQTLVAGLVCFSLCAVLAAAVDAAEGKKVDFDIHSGHFEMNNAGLKGASSYLVLTDRGSFDKVFGVGATMSKQNFVAKNAFEKKMVVAVIKRGSAVTDYKVSKVTAEGDKLIVRYSTKTGPAQPATFASPLIVSVAKGDYKLIEYIENGKTVETIEVGKKQS